MQISSKFTIAIHTLLCIEQFSKDYKVTSSFIASSVNVNPVVIRRILGDLKNAGIVTVEAGVGGASIAKDLKKITLLDIFYAVDCVEKELFNFHSAPNPMCPVGKNIHFVLDPKLEKIENSMLNEMKKVTLEDLVQNLQKKLK